MENLNQDQQESDKILEMKEAIKKYRGPRYLSFVTNIEEEYHYLKKARSDCTTKRLHASRDHDTFCKLIRSQEIEMNEILTSWREYQHAEKMVAEAIELHTKVVKILENVNRENRIRHKLKLETERLCEREKMIPSILRDFTELPFCQPFVEPNSDQKLIKYRSCYL